ISAMNISSIQHVKVLAAAQKHVDNSISKTCNGATDDTVGSVDELYHLARKLGCKAVSYYRDGSREGQVLNSMKSASTDKPLEDNNLTGEPDEETERFVSPHTSETTETHRVNR